MYNWSWYGAFSAFYLFTQQKLPACKPVLTPAWVSSQSNFTSKSSIIYHSSLYLYFVVLTIPLQVITTFLFMGTIFIPVGLVTLRASRSVSILSVSLKRRKLI